MNFYSDKNVLVTGGLGFIGSNLARALVSQGAKVTIVDSLNPQYGGNKYNIEGISDKVIVEILDIRETKEMSRIIKDKDYFFNLAGQTSHIDSMVDPYTDLDINTTAQLSMLEICRNINPNVKIVFTSTRQLYGKPDYLPVDEMHPTRPVDVNGVNKLAGEGYHLLYNKIYGISSCVLRLTNTYGPGMRVKDARQTFLGIWIRLLIERNTIKVFGDGLQLRDFNYVDDCVEALLLSGASNVSNGKVYNLGCNEIIGLKDLAKMIVELNQEGSFELVPFPEKRKVIDIGDYYSDYSLITKELGWTPTNKLKEGLLRTIDFYNKNKSFYWN